MRVVAIAGAVFFLVVAAASGSPQHLTQKALEAPHRVGAQQLTCPGQGHCVGIGGSYVLVEHGDKWNAVKVPEPPNFGPGTAVDLGALSCPAPGRCVATGARGLERAIVSTQMGRRWSSAVVNLPSNARQEGGQNGSAYPALRSVSCGSAGNCAAVGYYYGSDQATHALLVDETGGTWHAGTDVQLPSDATIVPAPGAGVSPGGLLSSVSCPSAGSCTAVGSYTREDLTGGTYGDYPWVLEKSGGEWAAPGQSLRLPDDAPTARDYGSGASPFMGFTGLSCPSAGNCTAIGGYLSRLYGVSGVVFRERDGKWSQGKRLPVPADAFRWNDPMELDNPMGPISCSAPRNCAAIGWFYTSAALTLHGLLLVERNGRWKASGLALPPGAHARSDAFLTSVACRPSGDCVVVGSYSRKGHAHGFVAREDEGRWERAINAAVPAGAPPTSHSHTALSAVACASARYCLAGGLYSATARGGHEGLLLGLWFG
jgi:hypothetical protein